NVDAELVAINFRSVDTEHIYDIYSKIGNRILSFELLSKYFLRLIKNNDIKPTQVANRNGGEPLLVWAAQTGAIEAARLLLTIGADPNIPASDGRFPLHLAAQFGFIEIITLLLNYGARVNDKSKAGNTALILALRDLKTEAKCKETVCILLE